jgi:Fic family protein
MDLEAFCHSPAGRLVHTPGGYWAFVPHPRPPAIQWTPDLVAVLSEADRALGERSGLGRSLLKPHLPIRPFIRREAVLSSRIEGTQASLSALYAYEAVQQPFFEPTSDVCEVYKALQPTASNVRSYLAPASGRG